MRIAIAPDKFKGSLSGIDFCNAVEKGIKKVLPDAEILKLPLADGGDGTIEILNYHLNGYMNFVEVHDPLFRLISSSYLYFESTHTAFIEMAESSGMKLLKKEEQNCYYSTTFGTGETIIHAIQSGAKNIVLGIGGSATNDCGIGMASALGYKFLDKNGNSLNPIGGNLLLIDTIDTSGVNEILKSVTIKVACDVTNPLYGPNGAAYVYAAQKGASLEEIELLDKGLEHFAAKLERHFEINFQDIEGSGAAGGMGAGAIAFLNAELTQGIELVKEIVDFDNKIKDADWIITGEGKLDSQTLSGKTIQGVIASAKKHNIPVAALCGNITLDEVELNQMGISYADAIMNKTLDLEDALKNSPTYVLDMSISFANKILNV